MPPDGHPLLSRRALLALGSIVGLTAGLTACSSPPPAAPIPLEPDELAVNRAVAAARALRTDALNLADARKELADLLRRVAAVHEAHLVALGSPISAASPSASAAGSASAAATSSPAADPAPTASALIKDEIAASRTALRDGLAAAPAFAVLLCRIAAARVVNADLLAAAADRPAPGALRPAKADPVVTATPSADASSPTASSTGSSSTGSSSTGPSTPEAGTTAPEPTGTDGLQTDSPDPATLIDPGTPTEVALDRLLAGEHAAVFVYPLVIARSTGSRRSLAAELWQTHRADRDTFSTRLLAAGVRPAVAEPAYDVGTPPSSSAKAAALAARVETGLAALATDLLAAASTPTPAGAAQDAAGPPAAAEDSDLRLGADQLILAARRTAGWTGRPSAFPGRITRSTPAGPTAGATTTAPGSSGTTTEPPTASPSFTSPSFTSPTPPIFPGAGSTPDSLTGLPPRSSAGAPG